MRWSEKGAEAMLHICAHWRSYDGGDFYNYANCKYASHKFESDPDGRRKYDLLYINIVSDIID